MELTFIPVCCHCKSCVDLEEKQCLPGSAARALRLSNCLVGEIRGAFTFKYIYSHLRCRIYQVTQGFEFSVIFNTLSDVDLYNCHPFCSEL
jgi:hypothetical protein